MDLQVKNKIRICKKYYGCLSKSYMGKFGFYLSLDNDLDPNVWICPRAIKLLPGYCIYPLYCSLQISHRHT